MISPPLRSVDWCADLDPALRHRPGGEHRPEKNNRSKIRLDNTPWKFLKEDAFPAAEAPESGYVSTGFGTAAAFGMGDGGIFRPVHLHLTDPIHVPLNVYSNVENWGTNIATTRADARSATVRMQTNVHNESAVDQTVTLETEVVDPGGEVVLTRTSESSVAAGTTYLFDSRERSPTRTYGILQRFSK